MPYTVIKTPLEGVLILEPQIFGDDRGFFFESFNQKDFEKATGFPTPFVQDNHSKSSQGVLRGLHFQDPKPQGKLVRVIDGEVFDVVVDIRRGSPSLGQWFGLRLSAENKSQLWIPPGLAHGFLVLSDSAEFLYKTTDYWYPEHEKSLLWNDPDLAIEWPKIEGETILAKKDKEAKGFKNWVSLL
jgi:dTDP-4-dehydrorhamnose 3,5-epimerase